MQNHLASWWNRRLQGKRYQASNWPEAYRHEWHNVFASHVVLLLAGKVNIKIPRRKQTHEQSNACTFCLAGLEYLACIAEISRLTLVATTQLLLNIHHCACNARRTSTLLLAGGHETYGWWFRVVIDPFLPAANIHESHFSAVRLVSTSHVQQVLAPEEWVRFYRGLMLSQRTSSVSGARNLQKWVETRTLSGAYNRHDGDVDMNRTCLGHGQNSEKPDCGDVEMKAQGTDKVKCDGPADSATTHSGQSSFRSANPRTMSSFTLVCVSAFNWNSTACSITFLHCTRGLPVSECSLNGGRNVVRPTVSRSTVNSKRTGRMCANGGLSRNDIVLATTTFAVSRRCKSAVNDVGGWPRSTAVGAIRTMSPWNRPLA